MFLLFDYLSSPIFDNKGLVTIMKLESCQIDKIKTNSNSTCIQINTMLLITNDHFGHYDRDSQLLLPHEISLSYKCHLNVCLFVNL